MSAVQGNYHQSFKPQAVQRSYPITMYDIATYTPVMQLRLGRVAVAQGIHNPRVGSARELDGEIASLHRCLPLKRQE